MSARPVTVRKGNKGLTVKINLWALDKYKTDFDSRSARMWIRGMVTHGDTGENKIFNDAGELLTTLGKWNAAKLRELRTKTRRLSNRSSCAWLHDHWDETGTAHRWVDQRKL
jgi:hypothetical protein